MPDTVHADVDSLVYAAMEMGLESPWLEDFDCVVLDPGHGGRDPERLGPEDPWRRAAPWRSP
jgi:hypothetical protein